MALTAVHLDVGSQSGVSLVVSVALGIVSCFFFVFKKEKEIIPNATL